MIKKIMRDPLGHFLLAGVLLFGGLALFSAEEENDRLIVVDRAALLSFIQYRTKVFKVAEAEARLDAMSDSERQHLIDDYVEEEAMYRESMALGLAGDDYVIRRRMVQKLEFITQGFVEQGLELDVAGLKRFFEENLADYYIEPSITFAHVFLKGETASQKSSRAIEAQTLLKTLNSRGADFSDATAYGERFPYHVNYVERTQEFVESHFGGGFAQRAFDITLNSTVPWLGPIESQYGVHLINVKERVPGRSPLLEEVKSIVAQDYRQYLIRQKQDEAIAKVVAQYQVVTQ